MRGKSPLRLSPRCKSTEVAFWFSFWWMELIVSYVGRPMMGSIFGSVKNPTMSELAGIIGACWGRGGIDGVGAVVALIG